MTASERANLPRWRGQPGFFEIWFLVVFAPDEERAWWLRYTTFAPRVRRAGDARATLWAAAFDTSAREPAIALKRLLAAAAYDAGRPDRFAVRMGPAELAHDACRGAVTAGTHTIAWDLELEPAARPVRHLPWLLERLPLPTRVAHTNTDVAFRGWVAVDGVRHELDGAPGLQKHLWGTRRVEELFWVYCPRFAEDPAARLEVTAARPRMHTLGRETPRLTTVRLATGRGRHDRQGLAGMLRTRVEVGNAELRVHSVSARRALAVRAWCDPRSLAGYVYRDPDGWDVHVAQSDVASCEATLRERPHPWAAWGPARRLTCRHAAALELHAPEPLPGVRYVPWDGDA